MDYRLKKWLLSATAVELTTEHFDPSGDAQARKPWPDRIAGKMQSLLTYGWMTDQYAYGIAPKGATVVDGKLVLPTGVCHFSCVNPVDGVHRLTAARMLEVNENHQLFKIPSILFDFGTPHSVWFCDAPVQIPVSSWFAVADMVVSCKTGFQRNRPKLLK